MEDIKELSPEEVETIKENDNIQLIDVREDEEVAQGIIENALHIPLGDITDVYTDLDKEKEYIMICRSGRRSYNAAAFLQEQGFKVMNMSGGMLNWQGEIIIK
ncbi:rhodanese-like domain-containing protein [Oceanobacillus sojae]|uniref:rhodanese-like domain-containing protein n=1 Tax=Oceanobacillus sojae TaxID=582851 RepID=UPI0009885435|nr:rhodanese-like domain-containing protein [Oceanobacillus sojae]MCT1904580.1 rhodanese-like domain-containing protein [Oceanobacillus sojae]